MHLSCYVGLMCSSCSCSKYRHRLPARMDCMVWDDNSVHLYSPAEYGIEGSRPFHLDFTSVLRRRWSPSSSRFKFQQAGNWGAVWFLSTLHKFLCVYCLHCFHFHIQRFCLPQFWSALCLPVTFYFKCFFVLFFQVEIKLCFLCVVAASTTAASSLTVEQQASLHSTKDYHKIYSE